MKNLIVALSSLGLLCACGMENGLEASQSGAQADPLISSPGARLDTIGSERAGVATANMDLGWVDPNAPIRNELPIARVDLCKTEWIRPTAQGTLQSIPRLGVYGIAPVGTEVQSSYFRSNSVNEEYRRGIVEFYVPGDITSAVLQFREHRGWTSYPMAADTHLIEVYAGNLELDASDFSERAVLAGKFDTDPNLEPSFANSYDLTKAVQQVSGAKLGVRFSLEGGVGSGTSFADLALEVSRCTTQTRIGL